MRVIHCSVVPYKLRELQRWQKDNRSPSRTRSLERSKALAFEYATKRELSDRKVMTRKQFEVYKKLMS